MSIEAKGFEHSINEPSTQAKRALYHVLGLETKALKSPASAPAIIDFNHFWRHSGFQYLDIPWKRELFVGADYDTKEGKIVITEKTVGEKFSVQNQGEHLVNFHTEPHTAGDDIIATDQLADQIPDAYFGDIEQFLVDDAIQTEIIMRLISKKEAGIVMLLKTQEHRNTKIPSYISTKIKAKMQENLGSIFVNDETLIRDNHVAVYRGFINIPTKENINYLRKRTIQDIR